MGVLIVGTGHHLPAGVVTNDDVERRAAYRRAEHGGRSLDEWARAHHGGHTRRVAGEGEATSDLASEAARRALEAAGVPASELELIVLSTFTGDHRLPQAAGLVQHNLGTRAKFIQVDSACTGFVDGLLVAHSVMETQRHRTALVVSADVTSMLNDPGDWLPQTVFGDGAGAAVLERRDGETAHGIMSYSTGSDGDLGEYVFVPGGGSRRPVSGDVLSAGLQYWRFRFAEITRWAVDRMVLATREALTRAGIGLQDVSLIIPHQASLRILDEYAAAIEFPRDRVVITYPELGNVSGASIPISLDRALREGRISGGDWLLMPAVGAGMAWGALVYRWKAAAGAAGGLP
jgi:3-oxoacyl-[acyl-carrier-protein] synthase III